MRHRYAFLHKNFRELNFERRVIFFAHLLTLIICFFPWFEANPAYAPAFYYNAFSGPGFLIGVFIFVISLVIVFLFIDRLFEREWVRLPFSENALYFFASAEQLLLLVLMWSVLISIGHDFEDSEIRYGIFVAFIAQIAALVATFLNYQLEKQKQAQAFFTPPQYPPQAKASSTIEREASDK